MDADITWIRDQLESIQAQLRSITATINSNTNHHGQKIVELATKFEAHEREDELKHVALQDAHKKQEENIKQLWGMLDDKVEGSVAYKVAHIERMEQQAQGAAKTTRIFIGIMLALPTLLELYHLFGGK